MAGPMILAARLSRIPAALTEADAHLGLANRLAAPFASKLFLAYEIPGHDGPKVEVVGRPIPVAHLGADRDEARARFGVAPGERVVAVFGALAGATTLNEMAVSAWAEGGPTIAARLRRARLRLARRTGAPARLRPDGADGPLRRRARRSRHRRLPRRRHRLGARCGRARRRFSSPIRMRPADHQTLNARHFERGRRRDRGAERRRRIGAGARRTSCSPTRSASRRCAKAMLAMARVDAADRIAEGVIALARR